MTKNKNKKWNVRLKPEDSELVSDLSLSLGISRILSSLIVNRGYRTRQDAVDFIRKSQEILHDPFLFNDMNLAIERILSAIENKEKITIFGDYDVDGVTSVSILYLYIKSLGGVVDYYIPSRQGEGYGVSREAIKKLSLNGTRLMITVDTGVTAIDELEYASVVGIDVVVTDHHECTDVLPKAIAVINPKRRDTTYPFSHLAGVGVVFKLLCAIESVRANCDVWEATRRIAQKYSDLTAIGTVADVMPVIDENRIIISYGLSQAEKTDKIGLQTLIDICRSGEGKIIKYKQKKKLSSGFIGFTLAPRINAAGRISSASIAVELFLQNDKKKAEELAYKLCEINKERQITENRIADMAYEIVDSGLEQSKCIYVLDHEQWHHGVVGIVASRVSERYGVPSILISFEGNDDPTSPEAIGKGSGRSIGGFNLVDALNQCSDLLEKHGGHELAAGLTIKRKNLDEFKRRIEAIAKKCFDGADPEILLNIDCEISVSDITLELVKEISALEPYGVSNQTPVFMTKNVVITDVVPVGTNRHLKINFQKDNTPFSAMLFSTTPSEFPLGRDDEVDIAYTLDVNEFNGVSNVQISIKDIKMSERFFQMEKINEELYKSVKEGSCELSCEYIVPTREEFKVIYSHLLNSARLGKTSYRISRLLFDVTKNGANSSLNYVKLKTIIKVFRELNLISIEELDEYSFSFKLSYQKNKTSLDKSSILKKLKAQYAKK